MHKNQNLPLNQPAREGNLAARFINQLFLFTINGSVTENEIVDKENQFLENRKKTVFKFRHVNSVMIMKHSCIQCQTWISSASAFPTILFRAESHPPPGHYSILTSKEAFPTLSTFKFPSPYFITLFVDYLYLFRSIINLPTIIFMFVIWLPVDSLHWDLSSMRAKTKSTLFPAVSSLPVIMSDT